MTFKARLIVTGTRDNLSPDDLAFVRRVLLAHGESYDEIGVGDCPTGVDKLVKEVFPDAKQFEADWRGLGRKAGPERNGRMVAWAAEADEVLVLAFPSPTSKGTWDCVRKAQRLGLTVKIHRIGKEDF